MIKKSNIFSMNLKAGAVASLQHIGYLNGQKKSVKDKNLSDFVSRLIMDFEGVHYPNDSLKIKKKVLYAKQQQLRMVNDDLVEEMSVIATKLKALCDIESEAKQ